MSKANVLKLAQDGFGKKAANYNEIRPSYTEETINLIMKEIMSESLPACSNLEYNILELGAGTGKFTEGLAPRLPKHTRYLATEPSEDFLSLLRSKPLPVVTAIGAANAIPLGDNTVENIICAQCFHWFSNEESLQDMHRVLVPGGKLILLWNAHVFDQDWTQELYQQRMEVVKRIGATSQHWYNSMDWCKAIDASPLFSLAQHHSLPGVKVTKNIDQVVQFISTVSLYNALPDVVCADYLDTLRQAILARPEVNPDDLSIPFSSEIYVYKSQQKD